jgi:hypothetical protein
LARWRSEFNYRPTKCRTAYRMVVLRKNLTKEKGERWLFDDVRYFFYITNDWVSEPKEIVVQANRRCNQENLLAQLHGCVRALRAPVDNLESNWAYMVMTARSGRGEPRRRSGHGAGQSGPDERVATQVRAPAHVGGLERQMREPMRKEEDSLIFI